MPSARIKFAMSFALVLLTACGGKASQKDGESANKPAAPEDPAFVDLGAADLKTTPYLTPWQINEVYADTTDKPGLRRDLKFTAAAKSELKIGYQEVQVTECSLPGGANPTFTLVRGGEAAAHQTKTNLVMEQAFVVNAGEAIVVRVGQANPAQCHSIEVLVGVNVKAL